MLQNESYFNALPFMSPLFQLSKFFRSQNERLIQHFKGRYQWRISPQADPDIQPWTDTTVVRKNHHNLGNFFISRWLIQTHDSGTETKENVSHLTYGIWMTRQNTKTRILCPTHTTKLVSLPQCVPLTLRHVASSLRMATLFGTCLK